MTVFDDMRATAQAHERWAQSLEATAVEAAASTVSAAQIRDWLQRLKALAAVPAQEEGWHPIETAPLAQMVLLRGGGWRHPFVGQRNGDLGACYLDGFNNPEHGWQAYATHWMPLPHPPGAPAAPHDARETTEVQKHQEDTRVAPGATSPSTGTTATNLNGR